MKYSTPDYAAIGKRLRQRRLEMKLTQEKLAERAEISPSFVGHIERGEKPASIETLTRLCGELSLSLDYTIWGRKFECDKARCALYDELVDLTRRYGKSTT